MMQSKSGAYQSEESFAAISYPTLNGILYLTCPFPQVCVGVRGSDCHMWLFTIEAQTLLSTRVTE